MECVSYIRTVYKSKPFAIYTFRIRSLLVKYLEWRDLGFGFGCGHGGGRCGGGRGQRSGRGAQPEALPLQVGWQLADAQRHLSLERRTATDKNIFIA